MNVILLASTQIKLHKEEEEEEEENIVTSLPDESNFLARLKLRSDSLDTEEDKKGNKGNKGRQ